MTLQFNFKKKKEQILKTQFLYLPANKPLVFFITFLSFLSNQTEVRYLKKGTAKEWVYINHGLRFGNAALKENWSNMSEDTAKSVQSCDSEVD